jgi:hypothetical protein
VPVVLLLQRQLALHTHPALRQRSIVAVRPTNAMHAAQKRSKFYAYYNETAGSPCPLFFIQQKINALKRP